MMVKFLTIKEWVLTFEPSPEAVAGLGGSASPNSSLAEAPELTWPDST